MEPRSRRTSACEYGRVTPDQRESALQGLIGRCVFPFPLVPLFLPLAPLVPLADICFSSSFYLLLFFLTADQKHFNTPRTKVFPPLPMGPISSGTSTQTANPNEEPTTANLFSLSHSSRIELFSPDHFFADSARLPQRCGTIGMVILGRFAQQAVEFFVKQVADQFRRMWHGDAVVVQNFDLTRMAHALRDHQAINPIGREVLHVAVEQARALAIQQAVPIADDCSNRRTCTCQGALTDSGRQWPQIRMGIGIRRSRLHLVRNGELAYRNSVLVGMAGPRAVHQRSGFVLFVFGQHFQC